MDTTAHTLAFTIYALAANPTIQTRAQQEVDAFLSSPHDEGVLPAYLEAVLKESMRKYPTAATGSARQVRQPEGCRLSDDIVLPQNWWVFVNIYALHNSKEVWGEDAEQFRPERWLDMDSTELGKGRCAVEVDPLEMEVSASKGKESRHRMQTNPLSSPAAYGGIGMNDDELCFCPFSYGVRNCVGMNLSLMEMRVALLALVSNFNFELADPAMEDEAKVIAPTTFTMRPADGLPIRISKR